MRMVLDSLGLDLGKQITGEQICQTIAKEREQVNYVLISFLPKYFQKIRSELRSKGVLIG